MTSVALSTDFLVGLAIGLGVAAAAFFVLWMYFRKSRHPRIEPRSTERLAPPAESPDPLVTPTPAMEIRTSDALDTATTRSHSPATGVLPEPASAAADGGVYLSQRILVHLLRHTSVATDGERGSLLTQRGIGEALSAAQGALSGVLRRLEDAGAVSAEKTHVRGRDRRVKVYRLTARGRDLALRFASKPGSRTEPRPASESDSVGSVPGRAVPPAIPGR